MEHSLKSVALGKMRRSQSNSAFDRYFFATLISITMSLIITHLEDIFSILLQFKPSLSSIFMAVLVVLLYQFL